MSASAALSLRSWVETNFPLGETLAVGGVDSGGVTFHHGATAEFAACMDEPLWKVLAETLKQLAAAGCDAQRAVWVFEKSMLWTAARSDGACLGVFTPRDLALEDRANITSRLEAFVALT